MAHYAKVINNIVENVIVADEDVIQSGLFGDPNLWLKTSYNTKGGIYYTPNTTTPDPDQSKAFRKNFAQPGYTYDSQRDAFIPPGPPYPSWQLDETSCTWKAPVEMPADITSVYYWDEPTISWKLVQPVQ